MKKCYYFYMNYIMEIGVRYLREYLKDIQNIFKINLNKKA